MSREVMPAIRGIQVRPRPHLDAVSDVVPGTADPSPWGEPDGWVGPGWQRDPGERDDAAPECGEMLRPGRSCTLDMSGERRAGRERRTGTERRAGSLVDDLPHGRFAELGRRRIRPLIAAVAAAAALAVGALGGSGHAEQVARHQLEAATRVYLWADSAQLPADTEGGAPDRMRVMAMVIGAPVILEQVMLGGGVGDVTAGVSLLPGQQTQADLVLHPDCSAVAADIPDDPATWHAVVRTAGGGQSRQVPLDVLADPSALMLSLLEPCSATAEQTAAEGVGSPDVSEGGGVTPSPAVTVASLRATSTGRLTFTLTSRGSAVTRFTLPVATLLGSRARFTLHSRPGLPITVHPGESVRVTIDVTAACRSHTGTLPTTYGLLLPQAGIGAHPAAARTPAAGPVPLEGWDDGVAAAALTAAALRGCR